jgi:EamA domain-containing membrane protein RarD
METEVIRGFGLAAILLGFATVGAALLAGGNVPLIALGLGLTGLSMDLLRVANARDKGGTSD